MSKTHQRHVKESYASSKTVDCLYTRCVQNLIRTIVLDLNEKTTLKGLELGHAESDVKTNVQQLIRMQQTDAKLVSTQASINVFLASSMAVLPTSTDVVQLDLVNFQSSRSTAGPLGILLEAPECANRVLTVFISYLDAAVAADCHDIMLLSQDAGSVYATEVFPFAVDYVEESSNGKGHVSLQSLIRLRSVEVADGYVWIPDMA